MDEKVFKMQLIYFIINKKNELLKVFDTQVLTKYLRFYRIIIIRKYISHVTYTICVL